MLYTCIWGIIGSDLGRPVGVDMKKNNSCLFQDSNSKPLDVQSVASRYTDCAILAPWCGINYFVNFLQEFIVYADGIANLGSYLIQIVTTVVISVHHWILC
jgi:hypothetical protein